MRKLPYARHYNPRLVYFLPTFWKSKTFFQGGFFKKVCPYVWLVFKSGFWSRVGYSGAARVSIIWISLGEHAGICLICLPELWFPFLAVGKEVTELLSAVKSTAKALVAPTKPPILFLCIGGGEDLGLALLLVGSLNANNFFTAWGLAAPTNWHKNYYYLVIIV